MACNPQADAHVSYRGAVLVGFCRRRWASCFSSGRAKFWSYPSLAGRPGSSVQCRVVAPPQRLLAFLLGAGFFGKLIPGPFVAVFDPFVVDLVSDD